MKGFRIASVEIDNRYVLAPLAGFTDYSMRKMCSDCGAGLVYTEMESCDSILYHSQATIVDLLATKLDKKNCPTSRLALQIFGGKKDIVLKSIPVFESYGDYDFLDFNCGCPVPKVLKQKAGSGWLKRPDEMIELLGEMVKISKKPVICKIRLGFETILDIPTLVKRIEEVGVKAIAIHGRTRNELFQGPVHYDEIKKAKEACSIPIIANGGIDENNGLDILEMTGADAIMIGQRAIGYPKVFSDLVRKEEGLTPLDNSLKRQVDDLKKHLELIFSIKDERRASDVMRGISTRYIKGYDNCASIRSRLVHCRSLQEYMDVLDSISLDGNIEA